MLNITGDDILEEKLLKILKTENEDLLRSFVFNTLNAHREPALRFFHKIVTGHQGKMRFKILELLMQDAGKDLIPLMIEAIRLEKNVLFAKSLMFLYGNFDHAEALDALINLEGAVHPDLEKSYQKVAGKLKSRFRELFYITEFRQGEKNSKRMHHAAEMMIKEPHPSYPPFLNETLADKSLQLRKTACRTLAHLGDADTLEALCVAIPGYFEDRTRTRGLAAFLGNEKTYENPRLGDILDTLAMLGEWREVDAREAETQVRAGQVQFAVKLVQATLLPDETLITKDICRFLENFLEGGAPPKSEIKRVERLFSEHAESQTGLLHDAFVALGSVGFRLELEGLAPRAEGLVPRETPDQAELMAGFLGGYRFEASRDRLLGLLEPGLAPELVGRVLAALGHYTFDTVPEPLARLAQDPEAGLQRQTAMSILARDGLFGEVMETLIGSSSTIVQVDAIQTIAAHQLEAGYLHLLQLLSPDLNGRLQEVIITALEAFPDARTGEHVRPYLLMPNPYMIRFAALKTLLAAGGEERIGLILGALAEYPDKQRPEMVGSFMKMVAAQWQPLLLNYLDFWRSLLDDEAMEKVRPTALTLLDQVVWKDIPCDKWLEMLQHLIDNPGVKRGTQENKTIRIIILRMRACLDEQRAAAEPEPSGEHRRLTLGDLVSRLDGANLHEQVRAFRLINLHFKPEWLTADAAAAQTLSRMLEEVLGSDMQFPELVKIVLSLVARMRNPDLMDKARATIPRMEGDLAAFAHKLFDEAPEDAGRPIQRVLILDDTVLIAKSLQRFLTKSGFKVEACTQPGQALELLAQKSFDLLVLDLLMPGMNGFQFISESRHRNLAPANILMITSSREKEVLHQVVRAQINGLLLKPFPIQDLLDKIQAMRT